MDKHCANCIYRCYITAGLYCCDYITQARFWCHTKWLMELKMQKDELQLLTSPFPPSAPSAVSRWSGCGENG